MRRDLWYPEPPAQLQDLPGICPRQAPSLLPASTVTTTTFSSSPAAAQDGNKDKALYRQEQSFPRNPFTFPALVSTATQYNYSAEIFLSAYPSLRSAESDDLGSTHFFRLFLSVCSL